MAKKRNAGEVASHTQRRASKRSHLSHSHEGIISEPSREEGDVFKYDPLPTSQQGFRLMRVKSVDRWGTVWCGIYHHEASNCPDYTAISYCWGKDNDPCMIRLNGQAFKVGNSLWSLLQTLGPALKNKYLWIDAICIDQSSISERNHQVGLMGQIFSGARQVIAWVGLMDEDSEKALTYLRHVVQYKGPRTRGDAAGSSKPQNTETLLALRRFLERDYWYRTWIVQEVLLARRLRLTCGAREVKWSRFEALLELWSQADFPGTEKARLLGIDDCMIFRLMKQRQEATLERLSRLVERYGETKCQDSRDRIYALLALAADCDKGRTLDVDYEKSLEQVFCDVLLFCEDVSPGRRMSFAETLQNVLGLVTDVIQAFVRYNTTFTWESLRSRDHRVSDQDDVPISSTNKLQEYEGLLLGSVSSVLKAYSRGGMQACWDSGGSRLPHMDTIFEISGAKEVRFRDPPREGNSGHVISKYANLSFACIAEGDLVFQLGMSRMALVYRPMGTDSGNLVAVARTGNMVLASSSESGIQRKTFRLSPSDVLGLKLIFLAYKKAM